VTEAGRASSIGISEPNPLTVLIADDNGLFVRALEGLPEYEESIHVIACAERARTAGAAGYVTKDRILAELAAAIRSAARRG
jgi:inosine/xanthosine triphosphate pyrophosphatase family protein